MISRGYFLGEIVDALGSITQQVETRCTLGLTDLNKYLEDFFLFVLNEALNLNLVNANGERCNEPGIDLIDNAVGIGFQITSTKTSKKVNDTLEAVTKLETPPETVFVLIIGKAQGSYTLNEEWTAATNFSNDNIWDINSLCKKLIELPIDTLQSIYDYVKKELARVKIELEIPNEDGEYATTIKNYIENIPTPNLTKFDSYYLFHKAQHSNYELSQSNVQEDFSLFSQELSRLPRITREFYAFLLERRDEDADLGGNFCFNYNRLKRLCRFPSYDEEIILLSEHGFIDVAEPENHGKSPYITFLSSGCSEYFLLEFVEYTESNNFSFTKPIVSLDFSQY